MTREELKIGDWVSFEGKPFQIYDLSRDVVWFDEGAISALMEEIEPIPLTEEILEKNDCRKTPNNFVLERGNLFFFIRQNEDGIWEIDLIYGTTFVPITNLTSVHQLQHILWALGIDNDLKI